MIGACPEREDLAPSLQFKVCTRKCFDDKCATGNKRAVEKIKRSADQEVARKFARKIRILATKRGLTTNNKLGEFWEISGERARVLLAGKHKPHRETLLMIAKAFGVPVKQFFGGAAE